MTILAKSILIAVCSAFIGGIGLIAPANAQQPPPVGSMPSQAHPGPAMGADMMQRGMERGRPGMAGGGMMDGGTMPMMMGAGASHTEGRLAFIKTELKITDVQVPQWDAFADAVRANATAMIDMRQSMASQPKPGSTLPERLAMEDKVLSAHFTAFKKIREPLTKLYAVLSPEQKKVANGIVIGPMGTPMGMM
jgi:hypothetical protein